MIDRAQLAEVICEMSVVTKYLDLGYLHLEDIERIADAMLKLVGPEVEWCEAHHPSGSPPEHGCPACKSIAVNDRLREQVAVLEPHVKGYHNLREQMRVLREALENVRSEMRASRAAWMADAALVELEGRGLGPSRSLEIIDNALARTEPQP